jgi:hypothetical protein
MISDTHIKLNNLAGTGRLRICKFRNIDFNKNKEWLSDRA